jgi:hypothetical protein
MKNRHCRSCNLRIPAGAVVSSITLTRKTGSENFSELSKLFIKPSMPFQVHYTYDDASGKSQTEKIDVSMMTVYYPSPIRIENVQHDAVLSLGDPSAGSSAVILIPLTASNIVNAGTAFLDRVTPFIRATLGSQAVSDTQNIDLTQGSQPMEPSNPRCTGDDSGPKTIGAIQKMIEARTAERDQVSKDIDKYGKFGLEYYKGFGYSEADVRWAARECDRYNSFPCKHLSGNSCTLGSRGGRSACDINGMWARSSGQKQGDIIRDALDRNIQALKKQLEKTKEATDAAFASKIEENVKLQILKSQLTSCNDTSVPTGSDWDLTKIIRVDKSAAPGKDGSAIGSFYSWVSTAYQSRLKNETRCERNFEWVPVGSGRRYIVMTDPAMISPSALVSIRTLPYTEPTKAIDPIMDYVYKEGECLGCSPSLRSDPAYLKEMQGREAAIAPGKEDLLKIALGFFGAIFIAAGIYLAVVWTFKPAAAELPPVGDKLGSVTKTVADSIWAAIKGFFQFIMDLIVGKSGGLPAGLPSGLGSLGNVGTLTKGLSKVGNIQGLDLDKGITAVAKNTENLDLGKGLSALTNAASAAIKK